MNIDTMMIKTPTAAGLVPGNGTGMVVSVHKPNPSRHQAEQRERPTAAELQDLVLSTEDLEEFLQQVVDVAVAAVAGDVSAGITLVRDGYPATVASSSAAASRYEEIQYGQEHGPCLAAIYEAQTVVIDELRTDERFSGWRLNCLTFGLRSVLAIPLEGGNDAVGALNFYSHQPHTFDPELQAQAHRSADEASRGLSLAVRLAQHATLAGQLQTALTSRTVIDQAMGIIMGRIRCHADDAFTILRAASQRRNVKLHVVAQRIVDGLDAGSVSAGVDTPQERV